MSRLRRLLQRSTNVIFKPQDSFGYAAMGMAILMLVTRLSGIVKLQVLAAIYGLRARELDLFVTANLVPEFIFTVVAIGGINAALIPVLTQTSSNETEARLKEVLSSIVNFFFLILVGVCIVVFIFAPQVTSLLLKINIAGSDVTLTPENIHTFVKLLRILIFSPIILCISSIFSSILQVKRRFFITQLAPLFYNFGLILVALVISPIFNYDVVILAWGVMLGSLLHFLIQVPSLIEAKVEYSPFILNIKDYYTLKALKQAGPRTIGLTSDYIGNIFQFFIALRLAPGAAASFRYALSIRDIPVGMFGVATSQALFPSLSEKAHKKDNLESFQILFSRGIRVILFWTLPVTTLLFVLRTPLIRLLFSLFTNKVTLRDASILSYTLLFLSISIVFYSILNLVNRAFYSLDDSRTPTYVSIFTIFIEIALTYALVNLFSNFTNVSLNPFIIIQNYKSYFTNGGSISAVGGLATASTIAIFINLSILLFFLNRKGVKFFYQSEYILCKLASSLSMFVVGILSFKMLDKFFDLERTGGLIIFTFNVGVLMLITYYLCEKFLRDEDISYLDHPIQKVRSITKKLGDLVKRRKITGISTPQ